MYFVRNDEIKMFNQIIIDLEVLLCRFVRSLREREFLLCVQVCDEFCIGFTL